MQVPDGADARALRISVLSGVSYAAGEKDRLLRLLTPADLAQAPLPPGRYTAVATYRNHVLAGIPVEVQAGKSTPVSLPRGDLARIEHETGIARQSEGRNADIEHFERVIALEPEHVDARLQLSAHALANGSTKEVERHVTVIERCDPENRHAARIRKVLARLGKR